MAVLTTEKLTKNLTLMGLRGLSFEDMRSVINQALAHSDCGESIVFLDIREVWHVVDLESEHALHLLHQRLNGGK